jgi:hypothetical protein
MNENILEAKNKQISHLIYYIVISGKMGIDID